jgi:hypothetical protein
MGRVEPVKPNNNGALSAVSNWNSAVLARGSAVLFTPIWQEGSLLKLLERRNVDKINAKHSDNERDACSEADQCDQRISATNVSTVEGEIDESL